MLSNRLTVYSRRYRGLKLWKLRQKCKLGIRSSLSENLFHKNRENSFLSSVNVFYKFIYSMWHCNRATTNKYYRSILILFLNFTLFIFFFIMWSADSTTSVSSHQLTYTMLYNKDGIYQFTTEIRHIPFEKTCFATFRHPILCTKSHQLPTKCSHTWTTYKNAFQMLAGGMTICHMNKSFERPVTCSSLRFRRDSRCLWHPKTRRTATVRQLFGSSIDWMGPFHISTHRLTWRTHTWEQVRFLYGRW